MWNPRCPVYDFYYKKVRLSSHPGTKVRFHGAPGGLEHSLNTNY